MGRGSSKKRDIKKDGLTPAQTQRRERKKNKRVANLAKSGKSSAKAESVAPTETAN